MYVCVFQIAALLFPRNAIWEGVANWHLLSHSLFLFYVAAFAVGHEISHLVMGHLTQNSGMEAFLRGLEILILMLDPTEGLLSLGKAMPLGMIFLFACTSW
jgi:hypothetical protein